LSAQLGAPSAALPNRPRRQRSGNHLRATRLAYAVLLREVAAELGSSTFTISQLERREVHPETARRYLLALARVALRNRANTGEEL
jgi:hypothetical protein